MAQVLSQTVRAPAPRAISDDARDVGHGERRVGRGLDPDEACTGSDRRGHRGRIGHVHQRALETPARHHLAEQLGGAVVGVQRCHDVVAREERLEDRRSRRHPRGERERDGAALERGEAALQLPAGGIVAPRVEEAVRQGAVGLAAEGGGEVDRRSYGAGGRIDRVPGVHGEGLDAHRQRRAGTAATPLSSSDRSSWRTVATPSRRKRARVTPGPTRMEIASGGSTSNRSSSVRSSPMATMVVAASRSGLKRGNDPALVHAVGPDLDDAVARQDLHGLVAEHLVEVQAQLVGAAGPGLLVGHPVVPGQRRRLHLDERAGRPLRDLAEHGQHRLAPAPAELRGRHPLARLRIAGQEAVLGVEPDRKVAEPFRAACPPTGRSRRAPRCRAARRAPAGGRGPPRPGGPARASG